MVLFDLKFLKVCGTREKDSSTIENRQCRSCKLTAVGKQCRLTFNPKAPIVHSKHCTFAYGRMNVALTQSRVYYCLDGKQEYACLEIAHPTVCQGCVTDQTQGTSRGLVPIPPYNP